MAKDEILSQLGGQLSWVDEQGREHRYLRTESGNWKLLIAKRQDGEFVHQENGCVTVLEVLEKDERWSEANR